MDQKEDLRKLKMFLEAVPRDNEIDNGMGNYQCIVLVCLDAVLSINRKYYEFVVPRVQYFQDNFPEIDTLDKLIEIIENEGYENFYKYWNYKHVSRVETLYYLLIKAKKISQDYEEDTELESLRMWAQSVSVNDYKTFDVKGIGLATYQYIRMLLGASTVKPDVHIKKAVSLAIGRRISDINTIFLFEEACKELNIPAVTIDHNLWLQMATGVENSSITWQDNKWIKEKVKE